MSESIDYAEMLEIPVNTLNVVKKKGRKKKDDDLKSRAVREVNERMEEEARRADANALANGAGTGENGAERFAQPAWRHYIRISWICRLSSVG